jgi:hypothetical protein
MEKGWLACFEPSFAVPARLDELTTAGVLVDLSYGNDECPSFGLASEVDEDFHWQLFVEHPEPERRTYRGARRFVLVDGYDAVDLETDVLDEALRRMGALS